MSSQSQSQEQGQGQSQEQGQSQSQEQGQGQSQEQGQGQGQGQGQPVDFAERSDRFQGYRGAARDLLERRAIGVWSEVEVVNDRGSTFSGVILPRNETCDDLHLVIKLTSGYNVGLAADRVVSAR
ncbi:MAG: hypothetical protein FJ125_10130, partial [Deltaproteobacteria bacterium]|nr:hypothetical protein [Deltaproteobacteria bacterium]